MSHEKLGPSSGGAGGVDVVGLGIDLVDVARFSRVAARHSPGFLESLFTPAEIGWCRRTRRPEAHLAARFAAREAVLKALGTGLVGLMSWREIEVVPGEAAGTASLRLGGAVGDEAERQGVTRVHLALTTTRAIAAAWVLLEGAPRPPASDVTSRPVEGVSAGTSG
jgi:holo-[acyl-carrier protein] synthase